MRPFAYVRPGDAAELFEILGSYGSGARVLAGGTDLMVGLRAGTLTPQVVVDLKRVPELRPGIETVGDRIRVSATTVLADVIGDERVRRELPALVEAASTVGSVQIRNRATLAGNICNASPAADTAPALLVYGAEVVLLSATGARRIALEDFFLGPGQTALGSAELLAAVELPVPARPFGAAFGRLTRRRGVDLATIGVCCSVDAAGDVAYGFSAVAPRPLLAKDATGTLGRPGVADDVKRQALERIVAKTSPISDVRASAEYRHAMLLVLARRVLDQAMERRSWGQSP